MLFKNKAELLTAVKLACAYKSEEWLNPTEVYDVKNLNVTHCVYKAAAVIEAPDVEEKVEFRFKIARYSTSTHIRVTSVFSSLFPQSDKATHFWTSIHLIKWKILNVARNMW